jgi:hypothetical protein
MALFTLALLLAVAALGQIPFGSSRGEAVLRVSLRAVNAKAEICRDRTEAELEALPAHMRQPRVCDEVAPPYRLEVEVDGTRVIDALVEPGGLRGDRPLIVDRQVPLQSGTVSLSVDFSPLLDEADRRALDEAAVELPGYSLEREVELRPDRITLVTATGAWRIGIYGE